MTATKKKRQSDYIKLKSGWTANEIFNRVERHPREWAKKFQTMHLK
jgi:hypothetical protein